MNEELDFMIESKELGFLFEKFKHDEYVNIQCFFLVMFRSPNFLGMRTNNAFLLAQLQDKKCAGYDRTNPFSKICYYSAF